MEVDTFVVPMGQLEPIHTRHDLFDVILPLDDHRGQKKEREVTVDDRE